MRNVLKLIESLAGVTLIGTVIYLIFLIISKDQTAVGAMSAADRADVWRSASFAGLALAIYVAAALIQKRFYPAHEKRKTKLGDPR